MLPFSTDPARTSSLNDTRSKRYALVYASTTCRTQSLVASSLSYSMRILSLHFDLMYAGSTLLSKILYKGCGAIHSSTLTTSLLRLVLIYQNAIGAVQNVHAVPQLEEAIGVVDISTYPTFSAAPRGYCDGCTRYSQCSSRRSHHITLV